jgi:tRNA-Thr(GGU) m(6)t(6)A37 methyltransferase TsaA
LSTESCELIPIGRIRSSYLEPEGTPIQNVFASDSLGEVEVFESFADGLKDIEQFSHLYLVYMFHRSGPGSLLCKPFLDDQTHGVFATRAPRRPNPIGLSIVRLLAREGRVLRVADLDIVDDTPLLDIKPFVPAFDHRPDATNGWVNDTDRPVARDGADSRFTG